MIKMIQRRLAQCAIGPSTLRGQGTGVIPVARDFLANIDLSALDALKEQPAFLEFLETQTQLLANEFEKIAAFNWGAARKSINLFLRDCLYCKYTSEKFNVPVVETYLEIPLDSHVAKGLIERNPSSGLPRWVSIKGLTKRDSDIYQEAALKNAASAGMARIHFDLVLWRPEPTE
jgi:hypothetical protein